LRAGFPHSEILGSKLACQLPEAYRRLQRPSSPVVAKASTTCTCSLDPITLSTTRRDAKDHRERLVSIAADKAATLDTANAISYPDEPGLRKPDSLHFFRIVKEQPKQIHRESPRRALRAELVEKTGGANRDRTGDLLLAKQALSQLSYGPCRWDVIPNRGAIVLVVGNPGGWMVGLGGLEPPTPRLSSVCSNQLSYRPCVVRRCGRHSMYSR
jgi:hypothetical protein